MNRRGSGDTTGSTSRNIFIAPFPKPLSRENSWDGVMNGMDYPTRSPHRTPISNRSTKRLKNPEFVRSMLTGTSNHSAAGSGPDNGLNNLPADTVMLLNDVKSPTQSDDELGGSGRRKGGRMNRRGSFVKGSTIERFDANDSQMRKKRALQRREAMKNSMNTSGGEC